MKKMAGWDNPEKSLQKMIAKIIVAVPRPASLIFY